MTTYYMTQNNPIFRHAVRYAFWKTTKRIPHITDLLDGSGIAPPDTASKAGGDTGSDMWALIAHGENELDEPGRVALARWLFFRLDVDYDDLARSRCLSLLTGPEVAQLSRFGIDVQLHTHRHRLSASDARREIRRQPRGLVDGLPVDVAASLLSQRDLDRGGMARSCRRGCDQRDDLRSGAEPEEHASTGTEALSRRQQRPANRLRGGTERSVGADATALRAGVRAAARLLLHQLRFTNATGLTLLPPCDDE